MYDILAHPDLVKVWGSRAPRPDGDLRRFYDRAMDGIAESDVAIEVSTAGLRKPVGEIYPAAPFLEMCLEAGRPVTLSSDAHRPEQLGHEYERAVEWLDGLGVTELAIFEGRRAPAGAAWDERARRASATTRTGWKRAGGSILGGVEVEAERGLAGHSDADVLDPCGDRRDAGRRRARRHRPALPRQRRALARRRQHRPARGGVRASSASTAGSGATWTRPSSARSRSWAPTGTDARAPGGRSGSRRSR